MTESARKYRRKIALGMCIVCGVKPPRAQGKSLCEECCDYKRERRKWIIRCGICAVCEAEDAESGRKLCNRCTVAERKRLAALREARTTAKQCRNCKTPAVKGSVYCGNCKLRLKERARWNYHLRRLNGVCTRCGQKPPHENRLECEQCLAKKAEYQRKRKARLKAERARGNA